METYCYSDFPHYMMPIVSEMQREIALMDSPRIFFTCREQAIYIVSNISAFHSFLYPFLLIPHGCLPMQHICRDCGFEKFLLSAEESIDCLLGTFPEQLERLTRICCRILRLFLFTRCESDFREVFYPDTCR